MKDEIDDLEHIIHDYGKYFDKIYVTVTHKETHTKLLKKIPQPNNLVELSYFKWIDHFGKARRYNQRQIKTDYWMWIDTDDEIEGGEHLPSVPEYMDTNNLDDIWFPYDYTRRVSSMEHETATWRERIIKTTSKLRWSNDAVHENINAPGSSSENFLSNIIVKHRRTAEQQESSLKRNRLILEKDWQRSQRVPTAYYLGATYKDIGDYDGAIKKLDFVVEHSKSAALKFKAWQLLCECFLHVSRYDEALTATEVCISIAPDHPAPWYQRFMVYRTMGDHTAAMHTAEIAMRKQINPKGELAILLGHDPSLSMYRGPFMVAQSYLSLGDIERAYQLYSAVRKVAPDYIEEVSASTEVQWDTVFRDAHKDFKNSMIITN